MAEALPRAGMRKRTDNMRRVRRRQRESSSLKLQHCTARRQKAQAWELALRYVCIRQRLKTLAAVGQLPVTEPLLLLLWGTCLPLRPSSLQLALSPFVRPFLDGGALGNVKEV